MKTDLPPTGRNGWIDVARALSALAVALFHFNSLPMNLPPGWMAQAWHATWLQGYWGVSVFFVLSGYCIFPGWHRSQDCGEFLRRRCGRIFPPYWASLLLVVGLAATVRLITGVNDVVALPRSPQGIAASILLLTNPFTALPTVNWVYWTLTSLLAFYLVMAIALLLRRNQRVIFVAALHGLFCLVAVCWPPVVPGPWFFVAGWPVFGGGLALAVFLTHRRTGAAMLLVSALHASWVFGHRADPASSLQVALLTLVFLALVRNRKMPAAMLPLAKIGTISFSLYLVHVPVGIYGLMRFMPREFDNSLSYIGAQLLLLSATVGAAGLFFRVAERPFLPSSPVPST